MRATTTTILPLYHRTMRFLSDPYRRMKKSAVLGALVGLVLLYVLLVGLAREPSTRTPPVVAIHDRPGFQAPTHDNGPARPLRAAEDKTLRRDEPLDADDHDGNDRPKPAHGVVDPPPPPEGAMHQPPIGDDDEHAAAPGAREHGEDPETPVGVPQPPPLPPRGTNAPLIIRLFLPLVAGFCFGFLGSVPIAGPTSAMVLKLGIQGKYQAGLTIAFGGAISEATYAGIAFWGFGSFLAGAKFLLPVSKVLGAIMFTIVGTIFLRSDFKPSLDVDSDAAERKDLRRMARDDVAKNVLMGLTLSGVNPALLATYTGAIASVYGTGMLEFTLALAFVFAIGVCCGVSTWFFLLLSLLKKYKQRLKNQTLGIIMRGMGCFLLTLGAFCAKSSFDYFYWGPPTTSA